eukprot:TRINITY_DN2141_c0_g1_i1.p1 TRINITY_DN2141_c0_g1~~TRINITY_DN2141_c0_g1_i1.p1  ORF type:complete len:105 (-),score=14.91 TRINITY_DN2141_c0_g1_i1:413-727(-)
MVAGNLIVLKVVVWDARQTSELSGSRHSFTPWSSELCTEFVSDVGNRSSPTARGNCLEICVGVQQMVSSSLATFTFCCGRTSGTFNLYLLPSTRLDVLTEAIAN